MAETKHAQGDEELTRFEKLARALFGVQKTDVPKHEPKKRKKSFAEKRE